MLVRKGKGLDLNEVRIAQKSIDIDAKRVSGELFIETSAQSPERMGMIDFDIHPGSVDYLSRIADLGQYPSWPRVDDGFGLSHASDCDVGG